MKKTLRTLLLSGISILLCLSMLAGSTFAWFTDEVKSGNNVILAGNLDIEMYWTKDLSSNNWINAEDANAEPVFNYDKWEPGYSEVRYVKIKNAGSLAFRYALSIIPDGEVSILADVLDVYYVKDATANIPDRAALKAMTPSGTLRDAINGNIPVSGAIVPAGKTADNGEYVGETIIAIAIKMREDAGNEYKKLSTGTFSLKLSATQYDYEEDSFGSDYDVNVTLPAPIPDSQGTVNVTPTVDGKVPAGGVVIDAGHGITANVPEDVQMEDGANSLTLSVNNIDNSNVNIVAEIYQNQRSLDVHIEGVSDGNTIPIQITIENGAAVGLNSGNLKLYHVENGVTTEMTEIAPTEEFTAHNQFKYDPLTGDIILNLATFSPISTLTELNNKWNGIIANGFAGGDGGEDDPYLIATADQLAYFGARVGGMGFTAESFKDKYVKLACDIYIGDTTDEGENVVFYPIGYYNSEGTYEKTGTAITSGFRNFEGTFDGDGHTISDFYQNTWEMKGDDEYYAASEQRYRDGMGLFGKVYKGTVKNLTVKNFQSDGEYTTTGTIAAYADGATFENITIFYCNPRVYNIGNGGIVGCVGWYAKEAGLVTTFKNITVDNTNKISALWGSWDVACGGIVGQYYPTSGQSSAGKPANGDILLEDCHVAAQIDVYNDVCANYQYYAYRYAGMLIGSVRENVKGNDGREYPDMTKVKFSNCTVHFGDWNDYYYCELVANSLASYTHDHQMSRLTQIEKINVETLKYLPLGKKDVSSNWVDIPSGRVNYVIVEKKDDNGNWVHGDGARGEYATCYHFVNRVEHKHNEEDSDNPNVYETIGGEPVLMEDKQVIYREFKNLVTGYGWGVTSMGISDFNGAEVLDNTAGSPESIDKFTANNVTSVTTGFDIKLSELFSAISNDLKYKILNPSVHVSISNLDENGNIDKNGKVTALYTPDIDEWDEGTIKLFNDGEDNVRIRITIQDYYYCKPFSIDVTVTKAKMNYILNGEDLLNQVNGNGNYSQTTNIKSDYSVSNVTENGFVKIVANGTEGSTVDEGFFYAFRNNPRAGTFLNSETKETGQYVVIKYRISNIYQSGIYDVTAIDSFEIWTATGNDKTAIGGNNETGEIGNNFKIGGSRSLPVDNQWRVYVLDLSYFSKALTKFTPDEYGRYYANFLRIDILPKVNVGQEIDVEFVGMSNSIEGIINTVNEIQNAEGYNPANKVESIQLIAENISIPLDFDIEEVAGEYVDPTSGYTASGLDYHACIDFVNTNGSGTSLINIGHTDSTLRLKTVNFDYKFTNKLYFNGWMAVRGGGINKYVWSADGGKTWNDIVNPITNSGYSSDAENYANYDHFNIYDSYKFVGSDFTNGGFQSTKIQLDLSEYLGQTVDVILAAVPARNSDELCVMTVVENVVVLPESTEYEGSSQPFVSTIDRAGSITCQYFQNSSISAFRKLDMKNEAYSNLTINGWAIVSGGVSGLCWSVDGITWYPITTSNLTHVKDPIKILSLANTSYKSDSEKDFIDSDVYTFQSTAAGNTDNSISIDLTNLDASYNGKIIDVMVAAIPTAQDRNVLTDLCIIFYLENITVSIP